MSYRGRVHNGVVVLDDDVALPEGAVVRVEQVDEVVESEGEGGWAQELLKVAGTAKGLPSDLARNHDHYLYGTPKR